MTDVLTEKAVVIGRLGRPYGVAGWQHIQSFTQCKGSINQFNAWWIETKHNQWELHKVEGFKQHGGGFIAKISGITDKEHASLWSNRKIAVPRSALKPLGDGEFYWSDLEGLKVVTKQGIDLGLLLYLYENAGLDVMVVKAKDKERHIPFIWQNTVLDVDFIEDLITVDWDFDIA